MRWTKKSYFFKVRSLRREVSNRVRMCYKNPSKLWPVLIWTEKEKKRKKIEEELKKRRRRTNNAIKGKILLNPSSSKIFQIFFSKRSFYFAMAEKSPQGHYLVQGRKNGREMPYFFNTTLVEIYLSAWLCIYKDEFLQSLCGKLGVSY